MDIKMVSMNKILVIGAGIAGPALCYWLKRFGFSPVLIEKAATIRKGGQALDLRGHVIIELAKKMGIYEKVCEMRTTIEIGRFVDAEGNILHEEKGERFGFRQGEEVEILRGDLVKILMDSIKDVPCYFNQTVTDIQQDDEGVKVHFNDGKTESYDLVIGADGIYSATRRMVFDQEEYHLVNLGSYLSSFSIPNYLNLSHIEVLFESKQRLTSIASDRDPKIGRAGFMFRSQESLKNIRDEAEQQQFLRSAYQGFGWETANILELMSSSDDFYFDAIRQVKMKSWTKGRVALLGDAGYCASPLSGQGNNLAFAGAYILAGELKQAQGDYAHAFNRYNELLRPFVEATHKFGVSVSESFLVSDDVSQEVAEERSQRFLEEIKAASNAIVLPEYEN
jgi:2-polyprenyl-6-methoxyphenol hydroxylase-like FAD-dependent oxidoreductase